jgi:hypothetical protein
MIGVRWSGRGEHDVHDFVDELTVLGRWLGRDLTQGQTGVLPAWTAFRFRGTAVLALDVDENAGRMYLVRGTAVRAFLVDEESIDEAYAALRSLDPFPAVA